MSTSRPLPSAIGASIGSPIQSPAVAMPVAVASATGISPTIDAAAARPSMPLTAHVGRVLVYGFPPVFVILSWLAAAGFPYYLDSNESFLFYVHARNLEIWNPWEYAWLTAEATDPELSAPDQFYTHNPNGPRYLHYLLLLAGIRDLASHVLVLSLLGTGLTVVLLWRVFAHPALLVVPLAVVFDYMGFLSWTVNTYRVWMFVLFFGLVLAVQRNRPFWFGILIFCVLQMDFGVAAFVGATTVVLAVLIRGRRASSFVLASAVGAVLSLGIFGVQVLAFYGWDGFVRELTITYARRGTDGAPMGPGTLIYQAWHGLFRLAGWTALITHNRVILIIVISGIMISLRTLLRGDGTGQRLFLARLTIATTAGVAASSAVLYGYFVDGFVESMLPLVVFLIAPSLGVVALELEHLLAYRWNSPYLGALCGCLVLLPLLVASAMQYRPPIAVELFQLLQTEYRGRTIVSPLLGSAMAGPQLAFALTGGRAMPSGDIDVPPENLRSFEPLRDPDGTLTYVCVDTLYIREVALRGISPKEFLSVCDLASARMLARGHTIVTSGTGWTIMRLGREQT
jgi:hypothetical protein